MTTTPQEPGDGLSRRRHDHDARPPRVPSRRATPTAPTVATATAPTATPTDATDGDGTRGDSDGTDGRRFGRRRHATVATATAPTASRALSTCSAVTPRPSSSKVWASRVHLHQHRPGRLIGLLSLDDADHLLTSTAIRTPASGSPATAPCCRSRRTPARRHARRQVADRPGRRAQGARPLRRRRHHRLPGPAALLAAADPAVAELELEIGHPCQANAYLTPPGSQGFAVHSDSHDVFVFQTAGTKLWEVHVPTAPERPVTPRARGSRCTSRRGPRTPRASTSGSRLHVTIGINQLTWRSLVGRVGPVSTASDDGHLPAGYLERPDRAGGRTRRRLEALAEAVRRVDADRGRRDPRDRFLTWPAVRGSRGAARHASGPTGSTPHRVAPARGTPVRAPRPRGHLAGAPR